MGFLRTYIIAKHDFSFNLLIHRNKLDAYRCILSTHNIIRNDFSCNLLIQRNRLDAYIDVVAILSTHNIINFNTLYYYII